jgi:hypothetical protein
MQRSGQHGRSGDGDGGRYLGRDLPRFLFVAGWCVFGPHLLFPALEVLLCARLELLLLHLCIHPFWVFFSTVSAPVPLAAVVTLPVPVSFTPAALYASLCTLVFFITATPTRFVALAIGTAGGHIHLRVTLVLVAVAVTVTMKAFKVLLAQTLASFDVCPAFTILSWNATAIGVALVPAPVVFAVPCPAIVLRKAVANIVSVCGSNTCAFLRITRSLGWSARREEG